MPTETSQPYLSAVVSETEGGFIVSVSTISSTHDITIIGEEMRATLAEADLYIDKFVQDLHYLPDAVRKLYNLASGIKTVP